MPPSPHNADAPSRTDLQEAAEEVRAHLVVLRGGAPFLSSKDAALLVGWLEQGKSVSEILLAVELAAEARRSKNSRVPLALSHARRFLGKRPTRSGNPPADTPDHPLQPLSVALREQAPTDARPDAMRALATSLVALPTHHPDRLVRTALVQARAFLEDAWRAQGVEVRQQRLEQAREQVALAGIRGAAARETAAEALARAELRARYPLLTAATLWDLVDP